MASTTYINNVEITNGANTTSYLIEPTLFQVATTEDSGATYTTANLAGFTLITGATIQIKFGTANKANATLNISSTGAKAIWYNNTTIAANTLKVNHVYALTYDGTQWQVNGDIDTWRPIGTGATDAAAGNHGHGNITKDGKMSGSTASGTTTTSHLFLREDGTWAKPAYTTNTNTHRPIKMNGTQILGNNTTALDLVAGSHISLTNNNGAVTIANTLTASDLGLSSALRFVGKTTSTMSESFNGVPAGITNYTTPIVGDVVLDSDNNGEYVCTAVTTVDNITTYTWEWLGAESSFKLVQTAVTDPTAASTTSTTFIDTISQDTQGVITATKKTLPTASTSVAGIIKIGTTENDAAKGNHTHNYLANTNKGSKTQPIYITSNAAATCEYMFPIYYDNLTLSSTAPEPGAYCVNGQTNPVTGATEYGSVLSLPGIGASTKYYAAQLYISSASGDTSPVHAYIRRLTSTPGWSSWTTLLDNKNTYAADSNGNTISVARNTETTLATINGVAVKIKIPASDNTDMYVNVTKAAAAISEGYPLITSTTPTTTATQNTAIASVSMRVNSIDKNKFELLLGNSTSTTTTGGHYGQLALYGPTSAGTVIIAAAGTQWKTATLQAKDGTIAYLDDITTAIGELDSSLPSGSGADKTLTALTITDGKITAATFSDISITRSQISNFSHTHNYAGSSSAGGGATKATITTVTGSTGIKGYITFAGATSGDNGLVTQDSLSIYDTMASNVPTAVQLNIGKSQVKGSITLYSATNEGASGNLVPATITKNTTRTWTLPNASGTIALLTDTVASADAWTYARKVYTDLTNASTDVTINGGASDAAAIGIGIDGTLGVANGGTGVTTSTDIFATYSIEYIVGTQTAATAAWKGNSNSSAIYLGKTIAYKLPYAGTSTGATLTLTLADGTTTVSGNVYAGTVQLTTHYGAGSVLIMIWDGSNWRTNPYYNTNTNTATRQNVRTTDANYSLLFADPIVGTANNNTAYYTYRNDSIYVNPSTGSVYATTFNGALIGNVTGNITGDVTGNADTATNATNDSDGNAINTTYVKKVTSTDDAVVRFNGTNGDIQNSGAILTDGGTLCINPTTAASFNEGIRINQANNGWAEVVIGGSSGSTSGNASTAWLVGRRGTTCGSGKFGAIGDFTIEDNDSTGTGWTLHQGNGGMSLYTNKAKDTASLTIKNVNALEAGKTHWIINALTSAMVATSKNVILLGRANSTKNSGYIGFYYAASSADTNYLTLGFYAADDLIKIFPTGQMSITKDIDSSSTSTGSLITAGGVGIAKTLYVGTGANITGQTVIDRQTAHSTAMGSSQLVVRNSKDASGNYVAIEMQRGSTYTNTTYTSWQFAIEDSGNFHIRNNYKTDNSNLSSEGKYEKDTFYIVRNTGEVHIEGKASSNTVEIRSTAAESHIGFTRTSYNYITAPSGSEIRFQGGTTCDMKYGALIIKPVIDGTNGIGDTTVIYPGVSGKASLGTSDKKWKDIYASGTYYGKIQQEESTGNYARPIWFCYYDNGVILGKPGYNNNFTYNPFTRNINFTDNATITVSTDKTLGVNTTTGALTLSSTTGALTIQSSTGAIKIQNTSTGGITLSSGNTLFINKPTNAPIIFTSGGADADHEKGRFNINGMFQLATSVTQDTHKLLVNGNSAFNGRLGFITAAANTLAETAAIEYNTTGTCINFRIGPEADVAKTMKLDATAFYHATTNTGTLGTTTYKWKAVYIEAQSNANTEGLMFYTSTNLRGRIGVNTSGGLGIYGIDNLYFRTSLTDTTKGMQLSTTNLYPSTNDGIDLGSTTNEWKYTYSKKFIVEQHVTMEWNATDQSLDFIFA